MKWSIIGCGNISNKFCDDLLHVKNAKISAIASNNIKRLKIFGDKYKIHEKSMFQGYEEILDTEFDIAYIGLINSLHKNIVKTFATKGTVRLALGLTSRTKILLFLIASCVFISPITLILLAILLTQLII